MNNKIHMQKPIRVLCFGVHDQLGGVETFIKNHYSHMDHQAVHFDFVSQYSHMCFQEDFEQMGSTVYRIPNVKRNVIGYWRGISRLFKNQNYDVCYVNMLSSANVLPLYIAKKMKIKHIIAHSHNGNTPKGALRKIMHSFNRKALYRYVTDFWACSQTAGNWLFGKLPEGVLKVIPNAIDTGRFRFCEEKRSEMRKSLDIENCFVLGNVGRFMEQKNPLFLIDIFNKVKEKKQNSILLLIGEGDLQPSIQEKVDQLGLHESVRFLGIQKQVEDYYQAMDCFLLPSLFEGLPVVLVEAQTAGLMCFTSSTVTREVQLTDNLYYIGLEKPPEEWADCILTEQGKKRDEMYSAVKKGGYDIVSAAKMLTDRFAAFGER